jgi:putative transposase
MICRRRSREHAEERLNRPGPGRHHAGGDHADHGQKHRTCVERPGLTGRSRIQKQIIGILKEHQAGLPVAEICRRHGISDATFYTWRSEYGGLEVWEAKRLKALEEENRKLKKLLAEQMLDAATLREMLGKNF